MAKKPPISTADLKDLVPKLNRLVTSLKPSQRTALGRPFAAAAASGTTPAEIQKFLDSKTKIHPVTRSIALGIASGPGGGVTGGIASGPGGGVTGGIASGPGGGVTGGIASGPGGNTNTNPRKPKK